MRAKRVCINREGGAIDREQGSQNKVLIPGSIGHKTKRKVQL